MKVKFCLVDDEIVKVLEMLLHLKRRRKEDFD